MKLNTQKPEKSVSPSAPGVLDVVSIFPTIQGEGPYAGTPATFVRLAGCNLQCPFCDTGYTQGRYTEHQKNIAAKVASLGHRLVVITGGEPFRQHIGPLVRLLRKVGHIVQIETNGTLSNPAFPWEMCDIVVSPKAGRVHVDIANHALAYKYVLSADDINPEDGLPGKVLGHPVRNNRVARPPARRVKEGLRVYVQAADEQDVLRNLQNVKAAIASARQHGYILCLQIHKLIGLE